MKRRHSNQNRNPDLSLNRLYILLILVVATNYACCQQDTERATVTTTDTIKDNVPVLADQQPRDYSYSEAGFSRVKNLINFFENMKDSNSYDVEIREKQEVVISLSESASKMHFLMDGFPLESKCNKYVKLITKPNIRTFSMISLLVNEDRSFNEVEQDDANLLARLLNERDFNALGKLQTLIQTLEAEKDGKKSLYEPVVQQDLLNCLNYFIYRHQKAISGLSDYVNNYKNNLADLVSKPVETKSTLTKFNKLIDEIRLNEDFESHNDQKTLNWLKSFQKLYRLTVENHFEVPKLIVDFIADPRRKQKMQFIYDIMVDSYVLREKLMIIESNTEKALKLIGNAEYCDLLLRLTDLVEANRNLLKEDFHLFIHKPSRWVLIERLNAQKRENTSNCKDQGNSLEQEVHQDTTTAISPIETGTIKNIDKPKKSCPDYMISLTNELRAFNSEYATIPDAKALASSIHSYVNLCLSDPNSLANYSNWLDYSLMNRIYSWCKVQLHNSSSNFQTKKEIIKIVNLLSISKIPQRA